MSNLYFAGCGPSQNQMPIVADARMTPAAIEYRNPSPIRSAKAIGMNNGRPSGTRTMVSRASRETVVMSCSLFHTATKATMLTIGSVSNNARESREAIGEFRNACYNTTANYGSPPHVSSPI